MQHYLLNGTRRCHVTRTRFLEHPFQTTQWQSVAPASMDSFVLISEYPSLQSENSSFLERLSMPTKKHAALSASINIVANLGSRCYCGICHLATKQHSVPKASIVANLTVPEACLHMRLSISCLLAAHVRLASCIRNTYNTACEEILC